MTMPMKAGVLRLMIAIVLTLLLGAAPVSAQSAYETYRKDLDERKNSQVELDAIIDAMREVNGELVKSFAKAYDRDMKPQVLLLVQSIGGDGEGRKVTSLVGEGQAVAWVRNAIANQLRRGGAVILSEEAVKKKAADVQAFAEGFGEGAAAKVLAGDLQADLMFLVRVQPRGREGGYAVAVSGYDRRTRTEITEVNFNVPGNTGRRWCEAWAGEIAMTIMANYLDQVGSEHLYIFLDIVGINSMQQAAPLVMNMPKQIPGVERVAMQGRGMASTPTGRMLQLKVGVKREQANLFPFMAPKVIADALKQPCITIMADATHAVYRVGKGAETPTWALLAGIAPDPAADAGEPTLREQFKRRYEKASRPKIGFLVAEGSSALNEMAGQIAMELRALGINMVDPEAVKALVKKNIKANMTLRPDRNAAAYALALQKQMDYLLTCSGEADKSSGKVSYDFRLVNTKTGQILAIQRWPVPKWERNKRYFINEDDSGQVARFVTGNLLVGIDRYLQSPREIQIVIKDLHKDADLYRVAEALQTNVPSVLSTGDHEYRFGVGSFKLLYDREGDHTKLAKAISEQLQLLGSALELNLHVDSHTPERIELIVLKAGEESKYAEVKPGVVEALLDESLKLPEQVDEQTGKPLPPQKQPTITPKPNGRVYVVAVGMAKVPGAVNDARLIAKTFNQYGGVPHRNIFMMTDKSPRESNYPSVEKIKAALSAHASMAGPGDTLVFYYAGHGNTDKKQGIGYLALDDGDPLPIDAVRKIMRSSKATSRVMVLDCCRSGTPQSLTQQDNTWQPTTYDDGFLAQLKKLDNNEVTLAACKASQLSWASPDLNHGIFTWYFCKGLSGAADQATGPDYKGNQDGQVELTELFRYAAVKVPPVAAPLIKRVLANPKLPLKRKKTIAAAGAQEPFMHASYDGNVILADFRAAD